MRKRNAKRGTVGDIEEEKKYKISEIFYSIQGEGSYAGTPMVFVRFAGCNLKCSFCDTDHHLRSRMTQYQLVKTIRAACQRMMPAHVCFTGGEPCLQLDANLLRFLRNEFLETGFHLETNGTQDIPFEAVFHCVTVSPKMKVEESSAHFLTKAFANNRDLKIIYDVDNANLPSLLRDWGRLHFQRYYIQPCAGEKAEQNLSGAIDFVKRNPGWSLSIQLQKLIHVR